jgi:hypothetical protein
MYQTFAHSGVDAIQTAKKTFVGAVVQNEQLKNILNSFVDAQTEYTKSAIDAGMKMSAGIGEIITDRTQYTDSLDKFTSYFAGAKNVKKSK